LELRDGIALVARDPEEELQPLDPREDVFIVRKRVTGKEIAIKERQKRVRKQPYLPVETRDVWHSW